MYFDRASSTGNVYISVFVIKFLDDRRHVDYFTPAISTGTPTTKSIDSIFLGHDDSFMVFCPNCNTVGRDAGAAAGDVSEMCASVEITTSGTLLQAQRNGGSTAGYYSFIFIDWVGYKSTQQSRIDTNSFVRSVTHKEVSMDATFAEATYLSTGQITKNCIPFVTQRGTGTGGYQLRLMPMVIIYDDGSNQINIHRGSGVGTLDVSIYVVEFDPSQVKIQKGTFCMEGTSITKTIESVDLSKSFVIGSYHSDSGNTNWYHHLVQTKFNSETEIIITRYNSTGNIYGYYYVVEAIDDQFRVQSIDFPGGSSSTSIYGEFTDFIPSLGRTIFVGSYTHRDNSYRAQRATYRLYPRVDELIQMNKASPTSAYDTAHVFVVEFNKNLNIKVFGGFSNLTTGVSSSTPTFLDNDYFDLNRSMVYNLLTNGVSRGDGTTVANMEDMFHKMTLTSSGVGVKVERSTTSTNTYSFWQAVEFPPFKTHYFEGVVQEEGEAVSGRYVRAYRADTGDLMDSTTSASGTGIYRLNTTYSGLHYITCQDDYAGEDYNDLILGKMFPAEVT